MLICQHCSLLSVCHIFQPSPWKTDLNWDFPSLWVLARRAFGWQLHVGAHGRGWQSRGCWAAPAPGLGSRRGESGPVDQEMRLGPIWRPARRRRRMHGCEGGPYNRALALLYFLYKALGSFKNTVLDRRHTALRGELRALTQPPVSEFVFKETIIDDPRVTDSSSRAAAWRDAAQQTGLTLLHRFVCNPHFTLI